MREAIVVMPDCFTRYGGSQYLNSSATGRYEDHLVRELVPSGRPHVRTMADPGARAVVGKSSGGYGALVLAMRHPDVFGLVASHSGDCYFEYCYLPDFPKCLDVLARHGGSAERFLRAWVRPEARRRRPLRGGEHDRHGRVLLAEPPRAARHRPPVRPRTGELRRRCGDAGWRGTRSTW